MFVHVHMAWTLNKLRIQFSWLVFFSLFAFCSFFAPLPFIPCFEPWTEVDPVEAYKSQEDERTAKCVLLR